MTQRTPLAGFAHRAATGEQRIGHVGSERRSGVHVNYAETVLPMRDGLPKLKDFPKEFGGSGEVVPE